MERDPAAALDQSLQAATAHHRAGEFAEARRLYQAVLARRPDDTLALFRSGLLELQAGQAKLALDFMHRATAAVPGDPRFQFGLGQALQALQRWGEAALAYESALRLQHDAPDTLTCLGQCYQNDGQLSHAESAYRKALALRPDDAALAVSLAVALCQQREYSAAEILLRQTLERHPQDADAEFNLGNALQGLKKPLDAVEHYRSAGALRAGFTDALINLGNALGDLGRFSEALSSYAEALRSDPKSVAAMNNAGCLLRTLGRLEEAEDFLRQGLTLDPRHAALWDNLGSVCKDAGELDRAIDYFRRALSIDGNRAATHSNLAYSLSFQSLDPEPILQECRRWNARFCKGRPRSEMARHSGHRLRIGYVSPDFRDHCQSLFTVPLLSNHDHAAFEIYCYASVKRPDELTRRIAGYADVWRDVQALDDAALSRLIVDDGIDILVDLTMHMAGGRPMLFARRSAPVQIAWLAYPGTTGIDTVDYRLSDPRLDPPGGDADYSERTLRLADTFWCYDPLACRQAARPMVNVLPANTRGYLTLGCLNNPCKLTDRTLELWGGVMRALPESRLLLLAPAGRYRLELLRRLGLRGIEAERVSFKGVRLRAEYLLSYHDIDLGLDTFPYNGHTTSLDSLWMGVPVVTRVGNTSVGRGGLSQMHHLGLRELAADSDARFVAAAEALGRDLPRLASLRGQLRSMLEGSPLMDGAGFARQIEEAYREAWRG